MTFDKFFHKQKLQGWFTKEKWEAEGGGNLLLHELLLSPTINTAAAFLGWGKRASFLWWTKQTFSLVFLCTKYFGEFPISL